MTQPHQTPPHTVKSSVPGVALQWILNYSCSSNTDLATLTNVCRPWREITLEYLKGHFDATLEGPQQKIHPLQGLLLPDMALEIAKRRMTGMKMPSHLLEQESDAFCLAWFHPRGIKIRTVDLAENFEDSSSSSSDEDKDEMLSYKFHLKKATRKLKTRGKMSSEFKTTAEEWQGYRNATDVLFPFGYSTAFVREFLQHAAECKFKVIDALLAPLLPLTKASNNLLQGEKLTKPRTTTFAVRGATFARPHGFCLCWADNEKDLISIHDEVNRLNTGSNDNHRTQTYKLKAMQKLDKKRRIRMRDSLPRTCLSTLAKNPVHQGQFGQLEGRRQRCIQFLNADKNRAVYMRTHPFDCGPIQAPVTMFVVAIATEDGCFVSGLRRRFELGHLYGDGSVDSMVEMSPVCLATESSKPRAFRGSGGYQDIDSDDSSMFGGVRRVAENGDNNCNCKIQWKQKYERGGSSDDRSSDGDEESPYHSEVDTNRIVRGALGPGRWHVYTATFDGKRSVIRIDGVDEPLREEGKGADTNDIPILDGLTIGSDHLFDMSLCFGEGSEGEGAGSITELAAFKGAMDRQDIYKIEDHLMRKHGILHGSTGYAKYPLSVNSADTLKNLSEQDVLRTIAHDQWQEDKWRRDVHSLMMHAPPCLPPSGSGIPLRIVARHRSVAWYRCCEVTGKPIRVSRIGSKQSNGSSDW